MRKFILLALSMTLLLTPLAICPDEPPPRSGSRRGDGAGYSTRDATVLSMMGWGVGLALGIAVLCGILEQSSDSSGSSSH